jgi:alpha-L-fucosidase
MNTPPRYLKGYEQAYRNDPRQAALQWFRDARYGLFLHYGLYSLLGRHEWVQFNEKIRVADYAKLFDRFTADRFDAGAIAQLALDAGMRYITITTRHHESFCLFDTKETPFNSVAAPARRDLIGELASACDRAGLGLFLYYSHGRDWKHPHAPNNDIWGGAARPDYDPPEPTYAAGAAHDLGRYVDFMDRQIAELQAQYPTIAGIWLDGIAVPMSDKRLAPCPQAPRNPANAAGWRVHELYDAIHRRQPAALVSYKQGLLGTEDFFAPEHQAVAPDGDKPMEICTTMCPRSWGYLEAGRGTHLKPEQVVEAAAGAWRQNCNLLMNTGPLPDGSLDIEDVDALRRAGDLIRNMKQAKGSV